MHLSPLFSSKKIVSSLLFSGLFFCLHVTDIFPNVRPCSMGNVQQRLCELALRHVCVIIEPYTEFHLRYTQPICVMADRCAALTRCTPTDQASLGPVLGCAHLTSGGHFFSLVYLISIKASSVLAGWRVLAMMKFVRRKRGPQAVSQASVANQP